MALLVGGSAPSTAAPRTAATSKACSGPASLANYFRLRDDRRITGARTACGARKGVVVRFAKSCYGAYSGLGRCTVRAGGRWRCRSRIVGRMPEGVPSKVQCRRRKARVGFVVAHFPPTEPTPFTAPKLAAAVNPYHPEANCIDVDPPGTVYPAPDIQADGDFQIHLLDGLSTNVAQTLQSALVTHQVSPILHAGLGSVPRNEPDRVPIMVTKGKFDSANSLGVKANDCANTAHDAIVVRANQGAELGSTGAHELFHAYSAGVNLAGHPWWEEAAATWSEGATGFPEVNKFDEDLQFPNTALDATTPDTYPYAMSRFIQFLQDRGFIGTPAWPLVQQVIKGYGGPGATLALDDAIRKINPNSSLGAELGAFWGDRIRNKPQHGEMLRPGGPDSIEVKFDPGAGDLTPHAEALRTKYYEFKLTPGVARVEFEFEPPDNGYFWGGTTSKTSEEFRNGDSVSFCVGQAANDDLKWPGRFPVTFTNGNLTGGEIQGTINFRAQNDPGLCEPATPDNRACQLLTQAKVQTLLGAGSFPYSRQDGDSESVTWICFYTGNVGEVDFNLAHAKHLTRKQVRANTKKQIESLGLDRLKRVGDIAGIGTYTADGKTYSLVVFSVARDNALFTLGPGDQHQRAIKLAKRLAGQLD